MIIVPIKDDEVLTEDGEEYTVKSYSNLDSKGPCVYTTGPEAEKVYFKDIVKINGCAVKLKKTKSKNVFEAVEYIERKYDLPDIGTLITVLVEDNVERELLVKGLALHKADKLSLGLIIDCADPETDEHIEVTLDRISDMSKTMFNKGKFKTYYQDYFPKQELKNEVVQ